MPHYCSGGKWKTELLNLVNQNLEGGGDARNHASTRLPFLNAMNFSPAFATMPGPGCDRPGTCPGTSQGAICPQAMAQAEGGIILVMP